MSKDESFSSGAVLAQTSASEAARPQVSEADDSKANTEKELTDAPLEDEVLHGESEGEADEEGTSQR